MPSRHCTQVDVEIAMLVASQVVAYAGGANLLVNTVHRGAQGRLVEAELLRAHQRPFPHRAGGMARPGQPTQYRRRRAHLRGRREGAPAFALAMADRAATMPIGV